MGIEGGRIVGQHIQFQGGAMNPVARSMSALFWIGLAVLIVCLALLVVPIPRALDAAI